MTNAVIEIDDVDKVLNQTITNAPDTQTACLFTLIIYTHEKLRTDYFKNLAKSITQQFPCRIISIEANITTTESYYKVKASKEMVKKGNVTLAYDLISIETSGSELDRIPFTVIPNLVPDLAVYLIWGQDPTSGNDILTILKKYVTRLIIDSQCTTNLPKFAEKISHQIHTKKLQIVDMNWAQTVSWRDVLAQVFDDEHKIDEITHAKSIRLNFFAPHFKNVLGHSSIQTIYLQGWLASQLQWNFVSMNKSHQSYQLKYSNDTQEIDLTLNVVDQEGYGIHSMEIATPTEGIYKINLDEKLQRVVVNFSTQDRCDLPFNLPFSNGKKGHSLMNEIFFQPLSDHYVHMLDKIKNIDW